jgi:hypothetical protein
MKRSFRTKIRFFASKNKGPRKVRAHHQLIGLFIIGAAVLVILNFAALLAPEQQKLLATTAQNVKGFIWNSWGGWISMNNTSDGSTSAYGVNIDPSTKMMTGYAWSPNTGWICFGSTCSGTTPSGASPTAQAVNVSGTWELQGWAQAVNLGATDGWISLNCSNQSACGTSNYKVTVNFSTGAFSGWAWHAVAGNAGWGWMDFSQVTMDTSAVEDYDTNPLLCRNGSDDDLDGNVDCADSGCKFREPACPAVETNCSILLHSNCCGNGLDDDEDGSLDCVDSDCSSATVCQPENCTNHIDDNANGLIDCSDLQCVGKPGCEICNNNVDDDGDAQIDCDDSDCSNDPACTPAWLKTQYGNVYATLGIQGNPPPVGQANATYCLTSYGTITNFTSERGCIEQNQSTSSTLPVASSGYVSSLGRLDITGMLNGRYGQVVNINSMSQLPASLNGRVYVYTDPACTGPVALNAMTFANVSGANAKGSGLLIVNGCDLKIQQNLSYQSSSISSNYLKNLASLGIIVLSKYQPNGAYIKGGNLLIDASVSQVVGTIFAEKSIQTGTTGDRKTDVQLHVYGALISKQIDLQRKWSSPSEPAEKVEFDGRSVLNPPPGFQDVGKSLPSLTDRY